MLGHVLICTRKYCVQQLEHVWPTHVRQLKPEMWMQPATCAEFCKAGQCMEIRVALCHKSTSKGGTNKLPGGFISATHCTQLVRAACWTHNCCTLCTQAEHTHVVNMFLVLYNRWQRLQLMSLCVAELWAMSLSCIIHTNYHRT
jgi:hypothetical protein